MKPNRYPLLALPALLLVGTTPSCGGDGDAVLRSADGRYRVVHVADANWQADEARTAMEAALERNRRIDLVFAHSDAMASGAIAAARHQGRTGIRFVGIGALADEGLKLLADGALDATIAQPTLGPEAIDLALLACHGMPLPREFRVGTRMFTRTNLAEGGEAIATPADAMLVTLRRQHGAILTNRPVDDMVFRIGMAQWSEDDPWRVAMREDLLRAAKRYPQVEFAYRSADGDAEKQRSILRDFAAQGFHAVIVAPREPQALHEACKEALAANVKVIVVDRELDSDDFTCFVGSDQRAIGRAAGERIKELLPQGGAIVELQGAMTSPQARQRHQGFAEALALPGSR